MRRRNPRRRAISLSRPQWTPFLLWAGPRDVAASARPFLVYAIFHHFITILQPHGCFFSAVIGGDEMSRRVGGLIATIEAVVHIWERLRRLREERALRQEDLAKLAGIGKNTVNRIEKNRTEPHMTTIRKLADALKVDPADLVRGERISPRVTKPGERGTQKDHHPA